MMPKQTQQSALGIERYLALESFEVMEELLEVCGADVDVRALPLLKKRLAEEESNVLRLEEGGYSRMSEKSRQLIASLQSLIHALEGS